VYNTALVRQLCAQIIAEKDTRRAAELVSLLQVVIKDDQEEIRTRMTFLARKYADLLSESKAAD